MGCHPAFRQAAALKIASSTLTPGERESVAGLPMLSRRSRSKFEQLRVRWCRGVNTRTGRFRSPNSLQKHDYPKEKPRLPRREQVDRASAWVIEKEVERLFTPRTPRELREKPAAI